MTPRPFKVLGIQQIAIGGPVVEKMASLVNPRQIAARMTVPAEATRAGPTLVADSSTAASGSIPRPNASRNLLIRNTQ